jgi:hypothetical protein
MSSTTKTKIVRGTRIKIAPLRLSTRDWVYAAEAAARRPQFEIDVFERGFPKEFSKYIVIDGVGENGHGCAERLEKYLVIANRVIEKSRERIKDLEEEVKDLEGWRRNAAEQGQDLDERLTKTKAERDELKNERDGLKDTCWCESERVKELEYELKLAEEADCSCGCACRY